MYERQVDDEKGRSGLSPTMIILIVLAAVAVIFIFQNSQRATVNFLFLDFKAPEWVAYLSAFAMGVVLDRLFQVWWRRRKASPPPD